MGLKIVRFKKDNREQWGVVRGEEILGLPDTYSSLGQFLQNGREKARTLFEQGTGETVL